MNQDIVVSNMNISNKELQLKQRFLNNSRPEILAKPATPSVVQDPALTSFLDEMQNTLKKQSSGNVPMDLLKQQTAIVQQQAELLKQEQKNFQKVIQQFAKPAVEDPKRALAELLAPLNKQILDLKNYYEETKTSAKEISNQVNDLKKTLQSKRPAEPLTKSIEEGMGKFSRKKAALDYKVKETESIVKDVITDAQDRVNLAGCGQGIEYLREQIEAVNKDAEKIETDLQNRFKRIMQQVQKVKSIPNEVTINSFAGSEETIYQALGGRMDYDSILSELETISEYKTKLIQDYKKNTPIYPKVQKQTVVQGADKKPVRKPLQMHPVPTGLVKKTIKTKPQALQNIPTQPKILQKQIEKPRSGSRSSGTPVSVLEKPKDLNEKDMRKETSEIHRKTPTPRNPPRPTPPATSRSIDSSKDFEERPSTSIIPKAPSPQPFQTRPGVTKGQQTKDVINKADIYPALKTIETQEPPKSSIEQRTVDAVTEFLLTQILEAPKKKTLSVPEVQPSKWLGVEELSELTRLGIYVDPLTIDRLGKEVLQQQILDLKNQKKIQEKPPAKEKIERKPEIVIEKTPKDNEENEDNYDSDFEESSGSNCNQKPNKDPKEEEKALLFDKISPKTPPLMYEKRFEIPERSPITSIIERPEQNLGSLLDPRILGRMSAASIQHYITALIDAGHMQKPNDQASFLTRSLTPLSQPLTTPAPQALPTPQYRHTTDTTIVETKMPDEVKEFMSSNIGSQILTTIKENPHLTAQQVMENWAQRQGFNQRYPPKQEFPHKKTEDGIFGKPMSAGARVFDVEEEEKKVFQENSTSRRLISIPVLEIHRKTESTDSGKIVSDSDVSGLSHSGSVGSEVFNIENAEFLGGFMEFVRKARELEEGQVPGNSDLSEGEVRMDYEGLSSGEIPQEVLNPVVLRVEKKDRLRISGSGMLSDDDFQLSEELEEGEFDPHNIFKV
ncbi:hypothetical protein SteCoe_29412 [Stentor coeruleus]|uniref:Uncharacterized protein n=1 Tax=Stentor coeruleus TaxID=5963 RepID=A0A1R2B639_9CILI|nr:hypothetical protein SteCoe_29412 [Stentor coeruleus]